MSTPTWDIGAILNSIVNAFMTVVQSIADAISNNAGVIGQAIALGAVLYGVGVAITRTPVGRWLRRIVPFL